MAERKDLPERPEGMSDEANEKLSAIMNSELYWRRTPLNELRLAEGFEPITQEELDARITKVGSATVQRGSDLRFKTKEESRRASRGFWVGGRPGDPKTKP